MQATSNLNKQAKSKSQNPKIKQRKIEEVKPPQRWQRQAMSGLGSGVVKLGVKRRKRVRLNKSEGEIGEGFAARNKEKPPWLWHG